MSHIRISPPPYTLEFDSVWRTWLNNIFERIGNGPFMIKGYTVATVPDANMYSDGTDFSSIIYVSDETGGSTLAFTDGTNWRRVQDRAIIA